MKQITFADAEYSGKRKRSRKELFLIEADQVAPWKGLVALIVPHYPKGEDRTSNILIDGDAAGSSDAELVRLQRSGDERVALRDHNFAPVCWAGTGAYPG